MHTGSYSLMNIHEKYNKYMDCVTKIHEKCFSFLFIEENNVLIDTALLIHDNNNKYAENVLWIGQLKNKFIPSIMFKQSPRSVDVILQSF